jgi:beta-N-acetylhexosaminidase
MELDAMIGMRLAVGFPGAEATPQVIEGLQRIHARNLVVFSRNFETPDQFRRLVAQLRDALGSVWIMVDHEGGPVIRFRNGVTQFPSARDVAATQPVEAAARQGAIEAEELRHLGVGANLAPCVDVVVDGSDPIIGERSYGADPERVAQYACARIRGLQSHGVAACAKHFPGLGAVPRDPHRTLPTIGLGWQEMEEIHLPPFEAAVQAGVAMVMSSHVCYPGLGEPAGLPATFSRRLARDLLRERLQFAGLILTDDLEMGALKAFGSMPEIALQATLAGHDMLLICSDLDAAITAHQGLRQAYTQGRLDSASLESTLRRIQEARQMYSY